jgi:hypothetical protein
MAIMDRSCKTDRYHASGGKADGVPESIAVGRSLDWPLGSLADSLSAFFFLAQPRIGVPGPLDSWLAYVSWPVVLVTTTNPYNQATLPHFLLIIFFQRLERCFEKLSGLSRPGEVASACHMRWASKPLSAKPSVFCSRDAVYWVFYCWRSRLEVLVAKKRALGALLALTASSHVFIIRFWGL